MQVSNPLFHRVEFEKDYNEGIDSIIDQLGRNCTAVCPGERIECPNCVYDSKSQRSTGVYKAGGPREFTGLCPVCRGSGVDPETGRDVEVVVKLSIERDVKPYATPAGVQIEKDAAVCYAKGWVEDLPAIRSMKYILLDSDLGRDEKYVKLTAPTHTGSIMAGRYFEMFLKRI